MRLRAVHWTGLGLLLMGALVVGTSADAAKTPSGHPFLLIGLDGGEWSVIEDQWSQGMMPNMKALVARGVRAPLQTDYGWSPVIWIMTFHPARLFRSLVKTWSARSPLAAKTAMASIAIRTPCSFNLSATS